MLTIGSYRDVFGVRGIHTLFSQMIQRPASILTDSSYKLCVSPGFGYSNSLICALAASSFGEAMR